MRPLLRYGVPAAAGLATGGYALSQGEDPGTAGLAGVAGGAGAYGGLRLAGKYGPSLAQGSQRLLGQVEDKLSGASYNAKNDRVSDALLGLSGAAGNVAERITPRNISKVLAAGSTPTSAALAGLGGLAAGGGLEAMGVPGFQQSQYVDPEGYGSSNSAGARTKATTVSYPSSSYA
jgi:hypothetical protein